MLGSVGEKATPSQETFRACYRKRHSWWHHAAYMRSAKVMLLRRLLAAENARLEGARILDYGFGAGSFFLTCPDSASLLGLELDPVAVAEVGAALRRRGFEHVDLRPLDVAHWRESELLRLRYDVVICSHVLEHLANPVELLEVLGKCLAPGGVLLVLLPMNERRRDPHHAHEVTPELALEWCRQAGLTVARRFNSDYACDPAQPVFARGGRLGRLGAQAVSLGFGLAAKLVGEDRWMPFWDWVGPKLGFRPTQLALALSR